MSNVIQFLSHSLIQVGDSVIIESPFKPKKKSEIRFTLYSLQIEKVNWTLIKGHHSEANMMFQLKENGFEISALGNWFLCNGIAVQKTVVTHNMCFEYEGLKITFLKKVQADKMEMEIEDHVVNSPLSILLEGETGTGKTSLAKKIHENSMSIGSFIHLNLGAIPFGLIESTLFGHKRGSFTGAIQDEVGAIAKARKGTLFLDELDSLPHNIQIKLLLMLDNGSYFRVGETIPRKVECRFFFSSAQPIQKLLKNQIWRKDFYYRVMAGHHISLSNLRDQPELIEKFISEYKLKFGIQIDPFLEKIYLKNRWEGNFRQLNSHFERKRITSRKSYWKYDVLDDELMNIEASDTSETWPSLEQVKKDYIHKVLYRVGGRVSQASQILGISELTIRRLRSA